METEAGGCGGLWGHRRAEALRQQQPRGNCAWGGQEGEGRKTRRSMKETPGGQSPGAVASAAQPGPWVSEESWAVLLPAELLLTLPSPESQVNLPSPYWGPRDRA